MASTEASISFVGTVCGTGVVRGLNSRLDVLFESLPTFIKELKFEVTFTDEDA